MRHFNEYKLAYTGLSLGKHEFQFEVTDTFFSFFDYDELRNSQINLTVELEKQSTMLLLNFSFTGTATVDCDRCGDDLLLHLVGDEQLIVKFGEGSYEAQTDDILVLSPGQHEVDISQYVYEFILLAVPTAHSHEKIKDCNQEVIKKLNELSQHKEIQPEDPRWAALKKYNNE